MRPGSPVLEPALAAVPVIPEHELLRPIASGAYGQVWLARSALGTLRAVKIVRRDRFDHAEDFEREFHGLQRFEPVSRSHEALVDILQIGRQGDWFYCVMELADNAAGKRSDGVLESGGNGALGPPQHSNTPILQLSDAYVPQTLRQRIRDGGFLPAAEVVVLGHCLASALAHLHAQGLVHRDVKPSNILFINGQPKLADAGLVAAVDDAHSLVGTPGYIPPEGPGTPKADIYSLGKVLYEAGFGKDRQEFPQLPPDLASRPDHAALLELNEIIAKACAQDPRQRHVNPQAILAELNLLQRGRSVSRRRALEHLWAVGKKVGLAAGLVLLIVLATRMLRPGGDGHIQPRDLQIKELMEQANYVADDEARSDRAIELYRQVIARDPKFAPAWAGLFVMYFDQGSLCFNAPESQKANARAALIRLKELAPDSAEYHLDSAIMKWVNWKFQEALEECHVATQKHEIWTGGLSFAHTIYGYYALLSGQPALALKEYQAAERLSGSDAHIQHHLGHPYFVLGDFDEALKHYQASLDLRPNWIAGHHFRGRVFEERKDYPSAIHEFELSWDHIFGSFKSSEEARDFFQALREAVRDYGEKGYWEKRLELAMKETPKNTYYISTLHARLGHKEEAYAWLREACDHHAIGEVMFDRCWDHNDTNFLAIVRGIGLMR